MSLSKNKQKHKRAKPLNIHNVVQHKGHNFSMCPLASISSKSTQLSCSHLPQMHMIHSWSVPASSSKLPKHTQHLSLSISSSALPFLAFFCAGLDDMFDLSFPSRTLSGLFILQFSLSRSCFLSLKF